MNIYGKLYLRKYLADYLRSIENVQGNEPLDLRRFTFIRHEIKKRLVRKDKLRTSKIPLNLKTYPVSIALNCGSETRIFLRDADTRWLNDFIHRHMIDMCHSDVVKHVKKGGEAKEGFLEFIDAHGINPDNLDWESLKRAENHIRQNRGMASFFSMQAASKKATLKIHGDGQTFLDFPKVLPVPVKNSSVLKRRKSFA